MDPFTGAGLLLSFAGWLQSKKGCRTIGGKDALEYIDWVRRQEHETLERLMLGCKQDTSVLLDMMQDSSGKLDLLIATLRKEQDGDQLGKETIRLAQFPDLQVIRGLTLNVWHDMKLDRARLLTPCIDDYKATIHSHTEGGFFDYLRDNDVQYYECKFLSKSNWHRYMRITANASGPETIFELSLNKEEIDEIKRRITAAFGNATGSPGN